jgi:hypothetical protein
MHVIGLPQRFVPRSGRVGDVATRKWCRCQPWYTQPIHNLHRYVLSLWHLSFHSLYVVPNIKFAASEDGKNSPPIHFALTAGNTEMGKMLLQHKVRLICDCFDILGCKILLRIPGRLQRSVGEQAVRSHGRPVRARLDAAPYSNWRGPSRHR